MQRVVLDPAATASSPSAQSLLYDKGTAGITGAQVGHVTAGSEDDVLLATLAEFASA